MDDSSFRHAGWAAYFVGVTSIVGLGLLFTFFAIGGPFGFLNDISAVVSILPYPIIALSLHRLRASPTKNLSLASASTGIVGAAGVVFLQALLVSNSIQFSQQLPLVLPAGGVVGLWLVISNRLASSRLGKVSSIGVVAGVLVTAGGVFFWLGFLLGGASLNLSDVSVFVANPLVLLGFILVFAGYLVFPNWALLLGKRLLSF